MRAARGDRTGGGRSRMVAMAAEEWEEAPIVPSLSQLTMSQGEVEPALLLLLLLLLPPLPVTCACRHF